MNNYTYRVEKFKEFIRDCKGDYFQVVLESTIEGDDTGYTVEELDDIGTMLDALNDQLDGMEDVVMFLGLENNEVDQQPDGYGPVIVDWMKYIANIVDGGMDEVNVWMIRDIGEWAWAELVAQKENDGEIHTQEPCDPNDTMKITQEMIDWATKYAQDNKLGDDWSII